MALLHALLALTALAGVAAVPATIANGADFLAALADGATKLSLFAQ